MCRTHRQRNPIFSFQPTAFGTTSATGIVASETSRPLLLNVEGDSTTDDSYCHCEKHLLQTSSLENSTEGIHNSPTTKKWTEDGLQKKMNINENNYIGQHCKMGTLPFEPANLKNKFAQF
jgi:hypothetical protein